ncbi:hypothetical protein H5410_059460 [Solanum commersonii]|uniref:Uncharacterized protein n=1 Tax=Solanum commersonii TaxID=4109 RepID=A0A9J5W3I6_SOLCO|nr:hypothetical protein H5410_059460 [Solanum commersonii]
MELEFEEIPSCCFGSWSLNSNLKIVLDSSVKPFCWWLDQLCCIGCCPIKNSHIQKMKVEEMRMLR